MPESAAAVAGCLLLLLVLLAGSIRMASYANSHFLQAFGISLGAGLSTGLGAALIFLTSSLNRSLLAGTLAFSAGVMVYVSLVEVIGVSTEYFRKGFSEPLSFALATGSFFGGVAIMAVVDRIVHAVFTAVSSGHRTSDLSHLGDDPAGGNGEAGATGCSDSEEEGAAIETVGRITERRRLLAMSAVVSAAIVLHNIPEGMATYVASFHSVGSGLPLAAAIAVHNIPEGERTILLRLCACRTLAPSLAKPAPARSLPLAKACA